VTVVGRRAGEHAGARTAVAVSRTLPTDLRAPELLQPAVCSLDRACRVGYHRPPPPPHLQNESGAAGKNAERTQLSAVAARAAARGRPHRRQARPRSHRRARVQLTQAGQRPADGSRGRGQHARQTVGVERGARDEHGQYRGHHAQHHARRGPRHLRQRLAGCGNASPRMFAWVVSHDCRAIVGTAPSVGFRLGLADRKDPRNCLSRVSVRLRKPTRC